MKVLGERQGTIEKYIDFSDLNEFRKAFKPTTKILKTLSIQPSEFATSLLSLRFA